jgi:hypothetical protein
MVAWTLAGAVLAQFGGDCLDDVKERLAAYRHYLQQG